MYRLALIVKLQAISQVCIIFCENHALLLSVFKYNTHMLGYELNFCLDAAAQNFINIYFTTFICHLQETFCAPP